MNVFILILKDTSGIIITVKGIAVRNLSSQEDTASKINKIRDLLLMSNTVIKGFIKPQLNWLLFKALVIPKKCALVQLLFCLITSSV